MREEKHILWFSSPVLQFCFGWWPYSPPKLGSAFYTDIAANAPAPDMTDDTSGGTGGTGGSGGSGGNGGNSDGGGTTTPPPATGGGSGSITGFAAEVNVGATKTEISSQASGLSEGCAVVVKALSSTNAGKQEVCVYSQGDKLVTVTYLNDRVISASKSGF
jgi:hypothetical protein